MHSSQARAKGDVSTLLRGGHFYFALTLRFERLTGRRLSTIIKPSREEIASLVSVFSFAASAGAGVRLAAIETSAGATGFDGADGRRPGVVRDPHGKNARANRDYARWQDAGPQPATGAGSRPDPTIPKE
jgi:hypothetical protein